MTYTVYIVRNLLIMLNNLQQMQMKNTSKRVIQKRAEANGYVIGNIIAHKISKI